MDNTSRLGLRKPDPHPTTGDFLDVVDLNWNADTLDATAGAVPCTSATRPTSPFRGQLAYETDTDRVIICTSVGPAVWKYLRMSSLPTLQARKTAEVENRTATLLADANLRFAIPTTGRFALTGQIWYRSTTNADLKAGFTHSGSFNGRWSWGAPSFADATKPDFELVFDAGVRSFSGTGGYVGAFISGTFNFSASGTFIFNWAQNTGDAASSTLVLSESWLRLEGIS